MTYHYPSAEPIDQLPLEELIDILGRLAEDIEDPDAPKQAREQALMAYNAVCDEVDSRCHLQ